VQHLATLSEELRENLGVGLRCRRHGRVIVLRAIYATPIRGYTATLATRMGVFVRSGVVSSGAPPDTRLPPGHGPGPHTFGAMAIIFFNF
jgi:hypothetical protein